MDILWQDIRHGLRTLISNPVTTIVAIISLAVGIGANTAIFSLINDLMLRPLPVREPGRLVRLSTASPNAPDREGSFSLQEYEQIRVNQHVFSSLFAWTGGGIVNIEANGTKYAGSMSTVTGEYFSTLGVQPLLGRLIGPTDLSLYSGQPSAVAVLGYGCWQSRFQADPGVVGKTIWVEDRPLTIIGVTPRDFSGLIIEAAPDVTAPIGYSGRTDYRNPEDSGFDLLARLKPGVGIAQARTQLNSIWPSVLRASLPGSYAGKRRDAFLSARLVVASGATGDSFLRKKYEPSLVVLLAMVGLLLLTSCANLANLMLAQAEKRRQEFGIRVALGAARSRIVRQMLIPSLMLSAMGALLGFALAIEASRLLLNTMWTGLVPLAINASPDVRVLRFTVGVSLLTGMLFGVSPAWTISRSDPAGVLQDGSRTLRKSRNSRGKLLISGQVSFSLVLVIGAVMFGRTLNNLRTADPGYRRDGLLIVQLFPSHGSEGQHMVNRVPYYRELTERLKAIPGVTGVSYSHAGPVAGYEYTLPATVPSSPTAPVNAVFEVVGPEFFQMIGMRLVAGREFTWQDNETSPRVAIISENVARRLFPSSDAIGRKLDFGSEMKGLEIVGIVNNASLWKPQSHEPAAIYTALMQMPTYNSSLLDIRVAADPRAVLPAARRQLESLGRQFPLNVQTLEQRSDWVLATNRVLSILSAFFGGAALLLAVIGIYGMTSFSVGQRTSEIGLRVAVGAQPRNVVALVMREVMWLVIVGIALGIPVALALSRMLSGMVFGVASGDALSILLSSLILLSTAAVAAFLPARRASHVDPIKALRAQ